MRYLIRILSTVSFRCTEFSVILDPEVIDKEDIANCVGYFPNFSFMSQASSWLELLPLGIFLLFTNIFCQALYLFL